MVNKTANALAITDTEGLKHSYFADCNFPLTYWVKNTGLKTVRVYLQGGRNATLGDMVEILNEDFAAGDVKALVIESPYLYVGISAKTLAPAETSTLDAELMWVGHI